EAVARARDDVVARVQDEEGEDAQDTGEAPRPAEGPEDVEGGARFDEDALAGGSGVDDDAHRVEVGGGLAVPLGHLRGVRALERREAESVARVALEDELHEAVAQSAHAVVEDDDARRGLVSYRIHAL